MLGGIPPGHEMSINPAKIERTKGYTILKGAFR